MRNFTILEDECPSKAFLNIDNIKIIYHEVCKLRVNNPKHEAKKNKDVKICCYRISDHLPNLSRKQNKVKPTKKNVLS